MPPSPPWQPSSPPVDADVFPDLIEGPPTVVHFWAPWNPYDKQLDANLQAVRKKFPRLRFFSANTDDTAFYGSAELAWAPGGGYTSSVKGTVTSPEDGDTGYKIESTFKKTFE